MKQHCNGYYGWVMGCGAVLSVWVSPLCAQEAATPAIPVMLQQIEEALPIVPPPVNDAADGVTSILFSAGEREAIAQARDQYSGRSVAVESEADLLDQLQGIKAAKKPEEELQEKYYAQFYLESLMYHTPTDWMAWLKGSEVGKKFTPVALAANDVGIQVIRVAKEEITYEWKPKDWQQVSKAFKGDNPAIMLDQAQRVVIFTLRVNQTISSYDMQIREGAVSPTIFVAANGTDAGGKSLPAGVETSKVPAVAQPVPENKKPSSGGILSEYKKLEPAEPKP